MIIPRGKFRAIGQPVAKRLRYYMIKRFCFKDSTATNTNGKPLKEIQVMGSEEVIRNLRYKDETWNYISNIGEFWESCKTGNPNYYTDNDCTESGKLKFSISNNILNVKTQEIADNWLLFDMGDINIRNYRFSFDAILHSEFTEFQLAFKGKDLGNRYRFMIRNNNEAVFEVIYKGRWQFNLCQKPYKLEMDRKYEISLCVCENAFIFSIDDECVYSVQELIPLSNALGLYLILWNDSEETPIDCELSNFKLFEINK